MIERGFESPIWMAQAIIANARPTLVKRAVIEMIEVMGKIEDATRMDAFEAIDMLVQISTTGHYHPPIQEDEVLFSAAISPEDAEHLLEVLRDAPEAEDVPDSYEDFMRRIRGDDEDEDDPES